MIAVLLAASASLAGGATSPCRTVARPIPLGETVTIADTVESACTDGRPSRRLRYDAGARVARAAVDLAPGDELGRVFLAPRQGILPGEQIVLTVQIGPVAITKAVTALQAGRPGQRLFVRDEAGQIFSARCPQEVKP